MKLHNRMLKKIKQYGGMEKVDEELNYYLQFLQGKDRSYIKSTLIYLKTAHKTIMNVEKDVNANRDLTIDFLHTLYRLHQYSNAPVFELLIDITKYNLKHTKRKIIPLSLFRYSAI